jgi:hypothetical protein
VLPAPSPFPSVRASARHDGRRLHECGIQDSEALVQAGAPLVEIGDPLNLKVVADLLSADATQIEKGAAGADRWVGRNSPPGDPHGPGGISKGIGARNRGATGPCHDL